MNEALLTQLTQLNLSPNEAKVYLALLEIGQTSAGEIIKRTRLHRSVVYETLDKLINRKLVFQLEKQKIAFYQPTDPQRLLQNVKTQEEVALELIPRLKDLINTKLPEITIYEGIESYKAFWLEFYKRMPEGGIDYVAGSIGEAKWKEYLGEKTIEKILSIQRERKIKWKVISFAIDPIELGWSKSNPKLYEFRMIDRKMSPEGNFNIFSDDGLILHSSTEPMVIEIKNPTLVRVFQNIFDILWETGKPIK